MYWGGPAYATFWGGGYYGYGWGGVYSPGYITTDTIVSVEILVYSLKQDKLVWAAQSADDEPLQGGSVHQGAGRQGGGPDEEGRAHPLVRGAAAGPADSGPARSRRSPLWRRTSPS